MNGRNVHISESIDILNKNLIQIAQVGEWADLMGYQSTKKFSRRFLRHYEVRPCKVLILIRLKSIYDELKANEKSNFEIARHHSMPDEKALNKFVNYHMDCCPSQLQCMPENQFRNELEKFGSEIG